MKKRMSLVGKGVLVWLLMMVTTAWMSPGGEINHREGKGNFMVRTAMAAGEAGQDDKTLSPYFFVKSDDPNVDQLPLKSTSVVVDIAGVIADVRVTQVYKNEGKSPLEAIYIFPASTKAAVYGMKMTIGERVITAQIQKREEARRAYEQAKQEGKSASLLEQQRPNVFQMNVANILPGDEIKTELSYTELLTPTDKVYEFVYPTVVGPRYSNQPEATAPLSEKWVQNPYLHEGEPPTSTFDITTRLAAGLPIQEMTCTSHKVDIRYENPMHGTVKLDPGDQYGGNRDFILRYRLAGDRIESGLLLYGGKEENFFLLMMHPPQRVSQKEIPPREYIFIVDVSGSMHGFPLDISKKVLRDLIGNLRPTDTFNVLLFSGDSQLMAERSVPATPENIQRAIEVIDRQQGGGGTELLPALKRALALPRAENVACSLVIVTDGYVSVETEAFDLISQQLGNANFFAFGIGSSVNRYLIEGMARVGAGEPFVITKPDEAPAQAEKFRQYIQSPVLTHIKLDFDGFDAYDVEPVGVPDIFAERPAIVFGKWKGEPKGKISLHGLSGGQAYEKTIEASEVKPLDSNSALRYLWARSRIARLGDYNQLSPSDERTAEITNLGLKYNLLTAYTSFIAIDTLARRKDGELTTVKQPLPLPQGVSDYAVGEAQMRQMAPRAAMKTFSAFPSGALPDVAAEAASPGPPLSKDKMEEKGGEVDTQNEREHASKEEKVLLSVQIRKVTVTQGLSESVVRQVIEKYLSEIEACCLNAQRALQGELLIEWVIDAKGNVTHLKILSPLKGAKGVKQCLTEKINRWPFPAPEGSKNVTVKVSFLFGPKENS